MDHLQKNRESRQNLYYTGAKGRERQYCKNYSNEIVHDFTYF